MSSTAPIALAAGQQTSPMQDALGATPVPSPADREVERKAAWDAAAKAAIHGPAWLPFRGQATLDLPKGMAFIPDAEASRLSRAWGNTENAQLVGLIVPDDRSGDWTVFVHWSPDGYVSDDDAAALEPEAILDQLRKGTEAGNRDRRRRGFPELEILGWDEPPKYDHAAHQLVWALGLKSTGADQRQVNYNTRALGREGYLSLNLSTAQEALSQNRPVAATLLGRLTYLPEKRYEDYSKGTDRVAAFGLAGLIGVVVAKKIGLLALATAVILKFAKVGILALAGVAVAVKRFFRRKPS